MYVVSMAMYNHNGYKKLYFSALYLWVSVINWQRQSVLTNKANTHSKSHHQQQNFSNINKS